MSDVVKATKTDRGIIVHELKNGETRQFLAVRGSISLPSINKNLPAYFCVFGEEARSTMENKPERVFARIPILGRSQRPGIIS